MKLGVDPHHINQRLEPPERRERVQSDLTSQQRDGFHQHVGGRHQRRPPRSEPPKSGCGFRVRRIRRDEKRVDPRRVREYATQRNASSR